MSPNTGTFITQDVYQGSIFEPLTLHKYLYAHANPVMNVDPSGYMALLADQAVAANVQTILYSSYQMISSAAIQTGITLINALTNSIIYATPVVMLLGNTPEFYELCRMALNGELSPTEAVTKIKDYITYIKNNISKSSGSRSSGSSASSNPGGRKPDKPFKFTNHGYERAVERSFSDDKITNIINKYSHKVYQSGDREVFAKKVGNWYEVVIRNSKTNEIISCIGGQTHSLKNWSDVTAMLNRNGGFSSLPMN